MSRYVSPKEYTELYPGVGIETVKKMLRTGKLKGYIDEDSDKQFSHYYILIDDNDGVPYTTEYVESLKAKIAKYEEKFKNIGQIATI